MKVLQLATLLLSVVVATVFAQESGHRVEVIAKVGPVIGETITAEHRSIARFLGVPYAKVPRRFRRSVPVDRWTTPHEALTWPPNCWQNPDHPFNAYTRSLIITEKLAEDCLNLNIWTPVDSLKGNQEEQHLRPVIVWFHGGALLLGSSALRWYEGETLAARADAVVVTVNYRLSAHGFLYSDEVDDVKGNQGLWDQSLALEWVQENIRYFGGDPSSVTIMGNSAGGWSVSSHVLSPVSRRLFRRAVLLSGATVNQHVAVEPEEAVRRWLAAIRQVGCAEESDRRVSQAVVSCLEQLSPEKVDAMGYLVSQGHSELPPLITIDGQFLPDHPIKLLRSGNYKTDVQLLVDTVKDEGAFMFFAADPRFDRTHPQPINLTAATEAFFAALDDNFHHHSSSSSSSPYPKEVIRKLYFDKLHGDNEDSDVYRRAVAVAFGDFLLGCPTLRFAREVFANAPTTATVYQWYLTAKLGGEKVLDMKWQDGAAHTDDIFPIFGGPFRTPRYFTDRERDISREVITFLGAFIRTGSVQGEEHRQWQSYFLAPDGQTVIAPYYHIANQHQTPDSFGVNLKEVECEYVWNRLDQYQQQHHRQ